MQMVRSSAQLQTPPWAIYFNSHSVFAHVCLVQGGRALQGGYNHFQKPLIKYKFLGSWKRYPHPGNPGWLAGMFLATHLRRERRYMHLHVHHTYEHDMFIHMFNMLNMLNMNIRCTGLPCTPYNALHWFRTEVVKSL